MKKAFIFDIDGTLIDSNDYHAQAWEKAFRFCGFSVPIEKIRAQIGKGADQLLPGFLNKTQREKYGDKIGKLSGEIFRRNYLSQVRPFPKVRELFKAIRETGSRIALASSSKEKEVEEYKIIAQISDLVEQTASADDAENSKPEPDIFHSAMSQLGNPPQETVIVIGDSPYDAIAARRAGLISVGVLCGGFAAEKLKAAGCHSIYESPEDLLVNFDRLMKI
ncbi:MAG TPA: HAD family hydrolase [Verrucomicrobiae bacterium]|nr:HAD family hydrolase [Verrucomicrobiae bacterium]